MRDYIGQIKAQHVGDAKPLLEEKERLTSQHRTERRKLNEGQKHRWAAETKIRNDRLNKGVRGLFDRLSGKANTTRKQNEAEAFAAFMRDKAQKQALIEAQMRERKALQKQLKALRDKQRDQRQHVASTIRKSLNAIDHSRAKTTRHHTKFHTFTL
jgi:hypothetical protein